MFILHIWIWSVGPVIDQGQCGSSYAFSPVASLEGVICAQSGKLVTLSVEQIIDCSGSGCTGGFVDTGIYFIY